MSNQAYFNTLQNLAYSSITTSYVAVGSQTVEAIRAFKISNNTDGDMFFTFDPTRNQMFVPANSFVLYDIQSDSASNEQFKQPGYSQLWVKYSSEPSSGSVYFESFS